jgi:hypothetical protein
MSDERLRDLERRVAGSPADFPLGHELVRELERAGERRRAVEELRRLYRLGDAVARRRLERLMPPFQFDGERAPRDGLADVKNARRRQTVVKLADTPCIEGVAGDVIVARDQAGLTMVDARTLETLWRVVEDRRELAPGLGVRVLPGLGWDTLVLQTDESRFLVLDARSATTRAVHERGWQRSFQPSVDDREAVFQCVERGNSILEAIDLDSGKTLWKHRIGASLFRQVGGGLMVQVCRGSDEGDPLRVVEGRATTTGARVWCQAFPPTDVPEPPLRADLEVLVFPVEGAVLAFDRVTGQPLGPGSERGTYLKVDGSGLSLLAVGSDEVRWRSPLDEPERWAEVVAGRHVWLVEKRRELAGQLVLSAFDVETGVRLLRDDVPLPRELDQDFSLVALDGVILLLAVGEGGLFVHQLTDT